MNEYILQGFMDELKKLAQDKPISAVEWGKQLKKIKAGAKPPDKVEYLPQYHKRKLEEAKQYQKSARSYWGKGKPVENPDWTKRLNQAARERVQHAVRGHELKRALAPPKKTLRPIKVTKEKHRWWKD